MIQYPLASLLVCPGLGLFDAGGGLNAARISRSSLVIQMWLICWVSTSPVAEDAASIRDPRSKVKCFRLLLQQAVLWGETNHPAVGCTHPDPQYEGMLSYDQRP